MVKNISILGSTGSIGTSTLDVIRSHPARFQAVALACGKNIPLVIEQIREFKPELVSVSKKEDAPILREALGALSPEIRFGEEGAILVATHPKADQVISGMVGAKGLVPTLKAIEAGKSIGLANKETMVIAGELMTRAAKKSGAKIFPVDSEHSAVFQALQGHNADEVKRIVLTASGGPFLKASKEELKNVSTAQALKHPNWSMGPKITIDSATLMNKGLEIIEARWLFDTPEDLIDVVIHPQSVIHSMVEYRDGSVIAQLGIPDMRIPIAYAMSFPERLENALPALNLFRVRELNFFEPDLERFPALGLARRALKRGGGAPCALNAANEVAVAAFLEEKIRFLDIPRVVESVLNDECLGNGFSLDELLKEDFRAREKAHEIISDMGGKSLSQAAG